MRDTWLELLDFVLRPARPHRERVRNERERHLSALQRSRDERAIAIANCEQRIQDARAVVFAANDGVVPASMTELEREWRNLSRTDPEAGLMDLWRCVTPAAWIDRKRWRDSPPAAWLDAIVALAADTENVEAAERAIDALRTALAARGTALGSRIRWLPLEADAECIVTVLNVAREAASAACPAARHATILTRARHVEETVHAAALARLPDRPFLARELGRAAHVDALERAVPSLDAPSPVSALYALWKTGYVLTAFDAACVTLAFPPLEPT